MTESKVAYRFQGFKWNGVEVKEYKKPKAGEAVSFKGVSKQVVSPEDEGFCFEVRYFEVQKDGYTTLEKHKHAHFVIVARGVGRVVVGKDVFDAGPFDIFVVPGGRAHQLINTGEEPFGFFCSVNVKRDAYRLLDQEELSGLLADVGVGGAVRVPKGYLAMRNKNKL